MSPDLNGNSPPSVVKRKKRPKKIPTTDCCTSNCNHFTATSHAYSLNMPTVSHSHYPIENRVNPSQILPPMPSFTLNCENWMSNSPHILKNLQIPEYSEGTEYSSLPTVNMHMLSNESSSSKRRFSDPGVPNDSDSSTNSMEENDVQKLKSQVNSLKEQNRRLSKEILELRVEVNLLKQQSGFKHYNNRDYEPGILTDIIREVREAARVREDAFFARVKHLLEEQQQQQLGLNHMHILTEKHRNNDRISKLEEQWKNLNISSRQEFDGFSTKNGHNSNPTRQVLELEREAIELRRELQDTRAKKEASDQKLLLLDKKLSSLINHKDISASLTSEDSKTESLENLSSSLIRNTSLVSHTQPKITLSGPVTDL